MSDEGFIGMPPGMAAPASTDSGTVRRDRPERPRTAERDEIVFFPVVPGPPAAEPERPAAWHLVVGGRAVPVEGVLYLGRNPVATAAHPDAPVLAVDDESKSVSKTHAMLEVDAGELWVHDLDSTNGVWVVPPGSDPIEVLPGRRERVPAGAVLELGDYAMPVELQ